MDPSRSTHSHQEKNNTGQAKALVTMRPKVKVGSCSSLTCHFRSAMACVHVWINMQDLEKAGAYMWFMPVWTWEELQGCRAAVFPSLGEERALELYTRYGGVARYVLGHPFLKPQATIDVLSQSLDNALAQCNIEQVGATCRGRVGVAVKEEAWCIPSLSCCIHVPLWFIHFGCCIHDPLSTVVVLCS